MSTSGPDAASALTCSYSAQEDRLLLAVTANGSTRSIYFTRRLTSKLINALAHMLEQSNAFAGKVPAAMRDDVILLEHIQALGRRSAAQRKDAAAPLRPSQPASARPTPGKTGHLAARVTLAPGPTGFQMVLFGRSGPLLQARMNRSELHRFLELFRGHAEAAGWNLVMESTWLQSEQSDVVIN